jgi:hypothetical protein
VSEQDSDAEYIARAAAQVNMRDAQLLNALARVYGDRWFDVEDISRDAPHDAGLLADMYFLGVRVTHGLDGTPRLDDWLAIEIWLDHCDGAGGLKVEAESDRWRVVRA